MGSVEGARTHDPKSGADLLATLMPLAPVALAFLAGEAGYDGIKDELRGWAQRDPVDALLAVVLGGGVAFYLAEREDNPACQSPWDGILYLSTALSAGHDDRFPTTPTGHALATFARTFGPALARGALAPTAADRAAADRAAAQQQVAVLERLDRIIELLDQR
ncbi:MAG: hypothetical protein KF773_38050 [Deltaproteobacteria bacterium]|nr:hypothetical protein [Deltaproteobacteria bacterium]